MLLSVIRGSEFSWYNVAAAVLSSLAVIFLTLPIHEFSHAFVASKLGDPTPKFQGRLTLNPFAHIDYIGALCIILFGFGWAKPVQINARYFKSPKWGMALSALAGPLSNIVVAFISLIIYNAVALLPYSILKLTLLLFFAYLAQINVYLAVFNLIPIPPLDGSRVLFSILPQKYYFAVMRYERFIYIALLVLLLTDYLTVPLNILSNLILGGLSNVAALPFNLI